MDRKTSSPFLWANVTFWKTTPDECEGDRGDKHVVFEFFFGNVRVLNCDLDMEAPCFNNDKL